MFSSKAPSEFHGKGLSLTLYQVERHPIRCSCPARLGDSSRDPGDQLFAALPALASEVLHSAVLRLSVFRPFLLSSVSLLYIYYLIPGLACIRQPESFRIAQGHWRPLRPGRRRQRPPTSLCCAKDLIFKTILGYFGMLLTSSCSLCSHMRMTRHPESSSSFMTASSLALLRSTFAAHMSALSSGAL